jgi:hypothetical protein
MRPGVKARTCNPSYLRGGEWEIPAQLKQKVSKLYFLKKVGMMAYTR